jgi:sugar diacid utilization regulator
VSRQTRNLNALIDGLMTTAQVKTRDLSRAPSAAVDATRFGPHATGANPPRNNALPPSYEDAPAANDSSPGADIDRAARNWKCGLAADDRGGQLDESLDSVRLYAEYRRLAAEQAALRRVAALVARGVAPPVIFSAVADEMRRCVGAKTAGIWRFEPTGEVTLVAAAAEPAALAKWPVGTRTSIEGNTLATVVQDTGRPARIDDYQNLPGPLAARVRQAGVRAAVGVPVIVDGRVWGLAAVGSFRPGPMAADTEVRISRFAELIAAAVVAGYRDEQNRQLLGETSQRPFLIDSLLEGRVLDRWSLCEVASCLRLPANGPFVVIAAEVPAMGSEALPEIESMLRSLDVYSAWRLQPDLQVGIVHVNSERHLDKILALVSRLATDRVGVSARFDDLRDAPHALHFAKVMLRGRPHQASPVTVFDGSILATAAVSAPDVMVKSIGNALGGFDDLPDADREMLFETFRVWQDNDASVRSAAEVLICHPNTVRHRLRRIEKRTGRSLSRPKDVAELCLAFEVHRRLM